MVNSQVAARSGAEATGLETLDDNVSAKRVDKEILFPLPQLAIDRDDICD